MKKKQKPQTLTSEETNYTTSISRWYANNEKDDLKEQSPVFLCPTYQNVGNPMLPLREVVIPKSHTGGFYYEPTCLEPGTGNQRGSKRDKLSKPYHPTHTKIPVLNEFF